jgi:hypothetical protein
MEDAVDWVGSFEFVGVVSGILDWGVVVWAAISI